MTAVKEERRIIDMDLYILWHCFRRLKIYHWEDGSSGPSQMCGYCTLFHVRIYI